MKFSKVAWISLGVLIIVGGLIFGCVQFANRKNSDDVYLLFNTDRNYKEYTKIAMKSAIENKNYDSIYHIDVLCVDMSGKECDEFKSLSKENVEVRVFPEKLSSIAHIGQYKIDKYVTRTDLFKFKFTDLFLDRDKVLYIDSDTLIRKDLKKLYNTNISRYYLAAVMRLEPDYIPFVDKQGRIFQKEENYYNCGVLLLNLDKMRKDKIPEKMIEAKNEDEDRLYHTQRIFNVIIPPRTIKKLSPIYNDNGRWSDEYIKKFHYYKVFFPYSLRYYTIEKLDKDAVIIHYSGFKKPWRDPAAKYGEEWRKFATSINNDFDEKSLIEK